MAPGRCTPEEAGVPSGKVLEYARLLEDYGLCTHDILLSRGDRLFYEDYRAPFTAETLHRQYSASKSFVALAVGFLIDEGKLRLSDRVAGFFPEECRGLSADDPVLRQTVEDMLTMRTAVREEPYWLRAGVADRVLYYFNNPGRRVHPGGIFSYDSSGSFVLGALVERLSGTTLIGYLREKLFRKIGVSENIRCLKCPGGASWGDSGILCTARDLWRVARFCLSGGVADGERLISREYLSAALSRVTDNGGAGFPDPVSDGYGYQFWHGREDSFLMNGMGCQFALGVPGKDLILIYNGDNQGNPLAKAVIIDGFFRLISENTAGGSLPESPESEELERYRVGLALYRERGEARSPVQSEVDGTEYRMSPNPLGITRLSFRFRGDGGELCYTNPRGDKWLRFGLGRNVLDVFPEDYPGEVGTVTEPGRRYRCACSAAWVEPRKLRLRVQIIDDYLGNLTLTFAFGGGRVSLLAVKNAEGFLDGYEGYAEGAAAG